MISQQLALRCLATYTGEEEEEEERDWVKQQVSSLVAVREALWPILEGMGTVRTSGAFYFLVPLPKEVCHPFYSHTIVVQRF